MALMQFVRLALLPLAVQSEAAIRLGLQAESCNEGGHGLELLQQAKSARLHAAALPYKSLVINLDSRPDRWEHMQQQLEPLTNSGFLQYERLPATNGSTEDMDGMFASEHDYAPMYEEYVQDWWGLQLPDPIADLLVKQAKRAPTWSDGERGCAMSHIRAWRIVAESTEPMIILEDDAVLDPDFMEMVRESDRILSSKFGAAVDILFLQFNTFMRMMNFTTEYSTHGHAFKQEVATLPNERSLQESDLLLDSGGYMLWPSGAKKLLEEIPLNYSAGFIMQLMAHRGQLSGYAINPPVVKQLYMTNMSDPAAMSDIEKLTS